MTRREVLSGLCATGILSLLTRDAFAVRSEWTPQVIQLAKETEARYGLPHGICRAMNQQENSGLLNTSAKPRVEKGFFNVGEPHYRLVYDGATKFLERHPEFAVLLPFDVERFQEATSWGPWQLMGFNLRDLGFEGMFLSNITLEEHFDFWGRFMSGCWTRAHGNLDRAMRYYNGPHIKASYVAHVRKYLRLYSY